MTPKQLKHPVLQPVVAGIFFMLTMLQAPGATVERAVFVARAETAFANAWDRYQADTNSTKAALAVGRTSAELADLATNDTQRAEVARQGISVCRQWLVQEPDSAPGHYYLAINLGQLAHAKAPSLEAFRLVHEVEREFQKAAALNVHYDYAGPARTLGMLYFQAPRWPLSIGSPSKAEEWLHRAAELAPNYPDNPLSLAEAQLKWRQRDELEATIKKMNAIWPAARTNLTGTGWEKYWQNWNTRRATLMADYERLYGGDD
jgi:tetratricopeptide (TPR) repeat protein